MISNKARIIIFLFLIILTLSIVTSAATSEDSQALQFNIAYYYFSYKENVPSPLKSTERNWLLGYRFTHEFQDVNKSIFTRFSFEYTNDETIYRGTTSNGDYIIFDSPNKLYIIQGNIGWIFKRISERQLCLSTYLGLGHYYWSRGKPKLTRSYLAHNTEYMLWFLPIGIRAKYHNNEQWTIALDLSMKIELHGRIKFNYSEVIAQFNNPKAHLKDKIALKIQLPLQYQLFSFWFIVITPWYEYFPFGQSNIVGLYSAGLVYKHIFEPESKTHKIGAYLGFKIKF